MSMAIAILSAILLPVLIEWLRSRMARKAHRESIRCCSYHPPIEPVVIPRPMTTLSGAQPWVDDKE